jgi:hypothetical protein
MYVNIDAAQKPRRGKKGGNVKKLVFTILLGCASLFAQDAFVTFYSLGSWEKALLKSEVTLGVPGKAPFYGWIFDGNRKLARLKPGHFMTLHLTMGEHTFSGSFNRGHPAQNALLPLTLEAGQHYFVRLTAAHKGFYTVQVYKGFLEQVACEAARQEASGAQPIEAKRVEKDVRDSLENLTYFPNCK